MGTASGGLTFVRGFIRILNEMATIDHARGYAAVLLRIQALTINAALPQNALSSPG
jgi:hypothetical protein